MTARFALRLPYSRGSFRNPRCVVARPDLWCVPAPFASLWVFHLTQFTILGLAEPILKALAATNYATPTQLQLKAIPSLLEGRDLCGIAQTGTGKTAAFALPSLHYFHENPKPRPQIGRAHV